MRSLWGFLTVVFVLFGACFLVLWLKIRSHDDVGYSEIETGLWMGRAVDDPPSGTDVVLNLCKRRDKYQRPVHRFEPITDAAPAPTLAWLREMVSFVLKNQRDGKSVYVHCLNGVSRSGMVVVATIMAERRWSRDRAMAFVRSKRPELRPHSAFLELLLEWEKEILNKPKESGA